MYNKENQYKSSFKKENKWRMIFDCDINYFHYFWSIEAIKNTTPATIDADTTFVKRKSTVAFEVVKLDLMNIYVRKLQNFLMEK